jgi:hypothetical protein
MLTIQRLALVLPAILLASACDRGSTIGLGVSPDPIPVDLVVPCARPFALSCSAPSYLAARWTVTVANLNDVVANGTLEVRVVDAATGATLSRQGTLSGEFDVRLGSQASITLPVEWKWPLLSLQAPATERIPPAQLAFVITVRSIDGTGARHSETVTIRERLPRDWEVF